MRVAYASLVVWIVVGQAINLAGGPEFLRPLFGPAGQTSAVLACAALTALRVVCLPGERRTWTLLAVGIASWGFGNVYWAVVLVDETHIPVPSPADIGYLLLPILAVVAALSLRRPGHRLRSAQWFDASAAALAVASAVLMVFWETFDSAGHGRTLEIVVGLSYPVTNLLLIGIVVGSAARDGWDIGHRFGLLLAGAAILVFTGSIYAVDNLHGGYVVGDWYDMGWPIAVLLMSAAAWQPHSVASGEHTARQLMMPIVFALVALAVLAFGTVGRVAPVAGALAVAALLALLGRLAVTLRENVGMLSSSRVEALSDPLTGLGNRRAFEREIDHRLGHLAPGETLTLTLFDLDGFKHYNDSFGHPAGDALLVRLTRALQAHLGGEGRAFRMGGDEFCVLRTAPGELAEPLGAAAAQSLTESGEGFAVGCSFGCVTVPEEAQDASSALRLADQRLYAAKTSGRRSTSREAADTLLRALTEHSPHLGDHLDSVAVLADTIAEHMGLSQEEREKVRLAAELHDIGKIAVPTSVLEKPGPLDPGEWEFIHRHTVVGERILAAAPSLAEVGRIVRSTHERWDGNGYPDRLMGSEIPLAARIVFVADTFDAITRARPYRSAVPVQAALAELARCAGTQFDPGVVAAFTASLAPSGTANADADAETGRLQTTGSQAGCSHLA